MSENEPREIGYRDVHHWAEFASWSMIALWPFLHWVNGPAVSNDQFVFRSMLIAISVLYAAGSIAYRVLPCFKR